MSTSDDFLAGGGDVASSPAHGVQAEAMRRFDGDFFRGVRERRVAPTQMRSSTMEIAAARSALANAGLPATVVDLVITNSCPSDEYLPNNATAVQHGLGARKSMAIGVDTGCTSLLSGMNVADALIRSGQAEVAVVAVSSQMTRLVDYKDRSSMVHGDAAGAVVLGKVPTGFGFIAHRQRGEGEYREAICCAPKDGSAWYEGKGRLCGHSRDVALAKERLDALAQTSVDATDAVLAAAAVSRSDVSAYFPHQGAAWTNGACARACGLEHAETVDSFPELGNVGSPSHAVNLSRAQQGGKVSRGDLVLLFGVGMGLNWACTLVRWGC